MSSFPWYQSSVNSTDWKMIPALALVFFATVFLVFQGGHYCSSTDHKQQICHLKTFAFQPFLLPGLSRKTEGWAGGIWHRGSQWLKGDYVSTYKIAPRQTFPVQWCRRVPESLTALQTEMMNLFSLFLCSWIKILFDSICFGSQKVSQWNCQYFQPYPK